MGKNITVWDHFRQALFLDDGQHPNSDEGSVPAGWLKRGCTIYQINEVHW